MLREDDKYFRGALCTFLILCCGEEESVFFFFLPRRERKILERVVKLLKTELNGKGQKKREKRFKRI